MLMLDLPWSWLPHMSRWVVNTVFRWMADGDLGSHRYILALRGSLADGNVRVGVHIARLVLMLVLRAYLMLAWKMRALIVDTVRWRIEESIMCLRGRLVTHL